MHPLRVPALALCTLSLAFAASYDSNLFSEMRWRSIGPLRGGRTRSAAGVPSQPNVLYIGVCNGGVWKSNDYGRTWNPIFDEQPTGSIGSVAVAPSNPNVIYVGSGEGLQRPDLSTGDGIYKSTDAGKTWTHLGLRDGQQIPQIAIDPRNPDRLFVAVLGHPYGPNPERGVYRSTDGGRTFEKVLGKDDNTGANDVKIDPSNPDIVYAALWEARQGPWENAAWSGPGGGLFKSTDGGNTWHPLTQGMPSGADGFVQANLAISPADPRRLYASVAIGRSSGIYRSDDAGEHWVRTTTDPRPAQRIGGGDVSVPLADPKNPDVVYVASVVTWKSTDAGKTWTGIRGAPGGDDYQGGWINPNDPKIILLVSDQGSIVTVNGGETWSSWYNQPTAQMYHANTDNAFPYRVCSGQQESGSACVESRGNDGEITFREWHPVGAEEYGYAVPDPLNPDLVFGGKLTRYDRRTGQVANVAPKLIRTADFRTVRTAPVVFSQADPHVLFFAANTLWKTRDAGQSWQQVSPDLTRKTWEQPASIGKYSGEESAKPAQRGVIYARRALPARHQPHLGRHGRRPDPDHRRWRPALEERHAARDRALDEGLDHGRRPFRRAHRSCRRQYPATRRFTPAHFPHPRRRQDLDGDRKGSAGGRSGGRGPRGSQKEGAAVRRYRACRLRLLRRRRGLAVAASQYAGEFRARHRREGRRLDRRHPRPRLLDPGRHYAAAANRRGGGLRPRLPV